MSITLDGLKYKAMIMEAALSMQENVKTANELNVFPVPDGDTGTNMFLTMSSAYKQLEAVDTDDLTKICAIVSDYLLKGARGNSGVILSLIFRGMNKTLVDSDTITGSVLADAFASATDCAYKSVMHPVEGTILTVIRSVADYCKTLSTENPSIECIEILDAALKKAKSALVETQFQNAILEKAGVVDAGGFGLVCILDGMRDGYLGIKKEREMLENIETAQFHDFSTEDILFTYCTEFIAERVDKKRNVNRFRELLNDIGDSIVVVEDDNIVKVHLHTNQPDKVLSEALKFGALMSIKIENMKEQHTEKVIKGTKDEFTDMPHKKYGIVSVSVGDGLFEIFKDIGVDSVITGGQTMNPSTEHILNVVDKIPVEIVYFFPNNKNIIMAAQQAAELSKKKVIIIPTKTIPQGITSILSFDPELSEEENTKNMNSAILNVRSGQITYAARSSEFDGRKIKEGEYLAIFEGRLCGNSKDLDYIIKILAKHMTRKPTEYISIIYGCDVTEAQANNVSEIFKVGCKTADVNVINGGQPIYSYIVSAE